MRSDGFAWRGDAMNRGGRQVPSPEEGARPLDPAAASRIYRDSVEELAALRRALSQDNPAAAADIQALLQELAGIDPTRFPGNPALLERIRTQVLPALENLELRLREQTPEGKPGEVRHAAAEQAPPGYADAVADYFRRLSEGK